MRAPIPLALPILMGSASGLVALSLVSVVSADPRPSVVVAAPDAGDEATSASAPPPTSQLDDAARAPAVDVRLAPSAKGVLGAWLVAGPFKAPRAARGRGPGG